MNENVNYSSAGGVKWEGGSMGATHAREIQSEIVMENELFQISLNSTYWKRISMNLIDSNAKMTNNEQILSWKN